MELAIIGPNNAGKTTLVEVCTFSLPQPVNELLSREASK